TPNEDLFEELYTMASEYTRRSFGLFVDGELVATSKDRSVLDSVLEQVLAYYVMDSEADNLEILNYVEIVKGEYSASYDLGYARILDLFKTGPSLKPYTVVKGDTLASLSEKSGISVPVLRLLNDIPVGRDVHVGQSLYYGKPYLQLTVKNTLTVTSAETVAFETEYTYSDEYFEGTKKVLSAGTEGIYEVVSHNVYVNGQASSTMEVSRTKIKEPVTQKVLIGTKPIAPSGKFIFPLKRFHYISSGFGWRWIFGQYSYHNAIDISANYGTPIHAADAGTVQNCGWDTHLGYFVEIDHGNGIVSIYGHASSLAKGLYTGKKVYQGEVISYVGSTGLSTGNHLHFSLYHKASKQYLDPQKYL
ncbi:MAG: M23 family metallopeptidase, partial [Clostridia bacterium]|nr:M23 family metallopeptidase [Clostridia bacterium]